MPLAASTSNQHRIYSIGHSNHPWPRFVELIRQFSISAIADVRSAPFSKWLPYFSRPQLADELRRTGIEYYFFGEQIGGRPRNPELYDADGRIDYERVRRQESFAKGLEQLLETGRGHSIAMLCAEEDPLHCHRGLMITPALVEFGVSALHVRGDGSLETTEAMQDRLLVATGVGNGITDGLFASMLSNAERDDFLRLAYQTMARRFGYRKADPNAEQV